MRLMAMRLKVLILPLRDIRCDLCVVEGRLPERQWSRDTSINRDPENGDMGLLMMPVRRRMRRRSKDYLAEEMEQEEQTWQSKVWPPAAQEKKAPEWTGPGYGLNKSMEVVLGGLRKEVNAKKREVVMVMDALTPKGKDHEQ